MNAQLFLSNLGHLLPYGLLLLAYLLFSLQGELLKNNRLFFAIPVFAVLLFFAGLREAITPDLERYREMYEGLNQGMAVLVEPSFAFLSRSLGWFGLDYHSLFFVYTFVTLLFTYLGIRNYTSHVKLAFLLYIMIPSCFLNMFVEMREVSAIAIAFYATSILWRKDIIHKRFKILSFAILSILFHFSAIVFWGIFLISYKFIRRRHSQILQWALLVSSFFIPSSLVIRALGLLAYPFLPAKYQGYVQVFLQMQGQLAESGQLLKSLIYTAMAGLFIYWGASLQKDDDSHLAVNLFVIGVAVLNVTRSYADLTRSAYYFLVFQVVIFPFMIAKMRGRFRPLCAAYLVVSFFLVQFLWGLFFYSQEMDAYPFLHYRNALLSVFM